MIKRLIATALFTLPVWSAIAQPIPIELECTVLARYHLVPDGTIQLIEKGTSSKPLITETGRFIVNRMTGVVMGAGFSNSDENITVIDKGSSEQGFKSISVNKKGYIQPTYLTINVFQNTPEKEFLLIFHSAVITGRCK